MVVWDSKDFGRFNIAMLAKQAWRIVNVENPPVTKIMQARYFPKLSFLDAKLGHNSSYVWRSIIETHAIIRWSCRRRIRNGQSTRIWQIPWLPGDINGFISSDMPEYLKDAQVVSLVDEHTRVWDIDVLNDIFNERDCELIQKIPTLLSSRENSWYWCFDDNSQFSVKN